MKTYYARHLPHWHPDGHAIFITWRLHGSLPREVLLKIKKTPRLSAGKAFLHAERALDGSREGPQWLQQTRVAAIVADALLKGAAELKFYSLYSWVVMPNHVHALMEPLVSVARITKGIKGVTARDANQVLGRAGQPFWQDESFDHWIRNSGQFDRVRRYIEQNPVAAGLVETPHEWQWSSAYRSKDDRS